MTKREGIARRESSICAAKACTKHVERGTKRLATRMAHTICVAEAEAEAEFAVNRGRLVQTRAFSKGIDHKVRRANPTRKSASKHKLRSTGDKLRNF